MAQWIIMPKQGQSVESCIITEWRKKEGEKFSAGEILFAYETDKAAFEEEAQNDGVILSRLYKEGDEVPVLQNVCLAGSEEEWNKPESWKSMLETENQAEAKVEAEVEVETEVETEVEVETKVENKIIVEVSKNVGISPRAKNLAAKECIDTQNIAGSGPQSRIIERDISAAISQRGKVTPLAKKIMSDQDLTGKAAGTGLAGTLTSKDLIAKSDAANIGQEFKDVPLSNIRKLIAKAMHQSLQNSAQLTHHLSADARALLAAREQVKAAQKKGFETNITLNDMVCFAVIKALKQFPQVNSHYLGNQMRLFKNVHLGLAVDTDRGLMVPALRNADELSITGLSSLLKIIAESCRKGNIYPGLLASEAASFTVSNLGNYGVEMFTPVINLPQSAILGVNTIIPRPKDLGGGTYAFVPHIGLSLTYNHQALDGGEATRFLKTIATEIENITINI